MARFEASPSLRLHARYSYSRRRSALKVDLHQQASPWQYAGPLTLSIQEMDGHFTHTIQMSGEKASFELPIHSKPKKTRKRRVILVSGEEVDIDLTGAEIDCIMLWLRVDPNYALLRAQAVIDQPDYGWQFQIELDKDVCGQLDAADALKKYATPNARDRLESVILNDQFFYRVRQAAALSMADNLVLTSQHATVQNGGVLVPVNVQPLLSIFRRLFATRTSYQMPKPNNFTNIQAYFVQQAVVEAIARCQAKESVEFLANQLNYNDNSRNKFFDYNYIGHLCLQLANCLPVSPTKLALYATSSCNSLSPGSPAACVISDIVTRLNIDLLPSPSPGFIISRFCLRAIRKLQKSGHLPNNTEFFKPFVGFPSSKRHGSVFPDKRIEAFHCFVDSIVCSYGYEEESSINKFSGM